MRPTDTFELHDKSRITYKEYYLKTYGKDGQITVDDQPLLASKPKPKDIRRGQKEIMFFVPELCYLTGLSEEARADFTVMRDLAVYTRVPPADRERTLTNFIKQINTNAGVREYMGGWNLRFADSMLTLNARVMPQENINQLGSKLQYRQEEANWSRDMRDKKLKTAVDLQNWVVIFYQRNEPQLRNEQQAKDFCGQLKNVGRPMGMNIADPIVVMLRNDRNEYYLTAIRQNLAPQTQMVMCIVPSNKPDRYNAIKKLCCVEHPVPSQVILSRTLSKKDMMKSVATKVAIQINCKMGGEIWPRVGMVVVKKRINSRFFARAGQGLGNPPPGTVIDNTVTKPEWYDFFVVSQSVRQGTVTPTHYNIIHDTTGLKPDHMQRLTYKLCHLYYNWPGTIRVPAPCQYAHKLAFLVGQSIHRDPAIELSDKLYFL
ncbi:hypothetical protein DPMN_007036 [Dreissena polymorpha]|uniref:Piwi n=1 Tax=Dreissena polymorpha TaxID=45954 RepID=A0A9D4MV51_DREPO|nr:hypothetical protein DPMN_007036 [Dreissena polymorpha]